MNKICKEFVIYKGDTTLKEAYKKMDRLLRIIKRKYGVGQIIFYFIDKNETKGILIYSYRKVRNEEKKTITGKFRGWENE